jgi:hypothetical protein
MLRKRASVIVKVIVALSHVAQARPRRQGRKNSGNREATIGLDT